MPSVLTLRYQTPGQLARHLQQDGSGQTMLLPWNGAPPGFDQYQRLDLCILLPDRRASVAGELLQTIPNAGMVVRLIDPAPIRKLVADADPAEEEALPEVSLGEPHDDTEFDGAERTDLDGQAGDGAEFDAAERTDVVGAPGSDAEFDAEEHTDPVDAGDGYAEFDPEEHTDPVDEMVFDDSVQDPPPRGAAAIAGITALSWPIERLQADWHSLPMPEKIRVARYGKRPARSFILRGQDRALHGFLLNNSKISSDEVAMMASMGHLAPDVLMRIVNSSEWTRHTNIARNLACHPKLPLSEVRKLLGRLPQDELRRLAKGGRVRAAVKRIIIAKLDGGR